MKTIASTDANATEDGSTCPHHPHEGVSLFDIEQGLIEELAHNWDAIRGLLKGEYLELSDGDLLYAAGQEQELLERIQKKTGRRPREEIENIIVEELRQLATFRNAG